MAAQGAVQPRPCVICSTPGLHGCTQQLLTAMLCLHPITLAAVTVPLLLPRWGPPERCLEPALVITTARGTGRGA